MAIMSILTLAPTRLPAQTDESNNFIINEFDTYIENMRGFCDFGRDFSINLLNQLSPNARAACSELRYEVSKYSRKIELFDNRQSCETQKQMPWAVCVDNLKLCQRTMLRLKRQIEDCRFKINIDTKTISKYKKTNN